jgi:hypothetical protein
MLTLAVPVALLACFLGLVASRHFAGKLAVLLSVLTLTGFGLLIFLGHVIGMGEEPHSPPGTSTAPNPTSTT